MRGHKFVNDKHNYPLHHTFCIYRTSKFSFYFILFIGYLQCLITEKLGAENAKTKIFSKPIIILVPNYTSRSY